MSPWTLVSNGQVFPGFKMKNVYTSDTVSMSCQTNDPKATVYLLRRENIYNNYENAEKLFSKPDGTSRLNQVGQNFTVVDITTLDYGHYTCDATSEDGVKKMLELGEWLINEGLRFFSFLCHSLIHIERGFFENESRQVNIFVSRQEIDLLNDCQAFVCIRPQYVAVTDLTFFIEVFLKSAVILFTLWTSELCVLE